MKIKGLLAVLLMLAGSALVQAQGMGVMVEAPWIREAPPNAAAMAGYLKLSNHSDKEQVLTAADSKDFGMVMLHRTVMSEGMAKMQHEAQIVIPAHGELQFAPNGYHLMLMHPKRALKGGDEVAINLHFADGATQTVNFAVRAGEGMASGNGGRQMGDMPMDMQHKH